MSSYYDVTRKETRIYLLVSHKTTDHRPSNKLKAATLAKKFPALYGTRSLVYIE
jgi:hypothetical protein